MDFEGRNQILTRFSEQHRQEEAVQNPQKHCRRDDASSAAVLWSSSSAGEDQIKLAAISISFNARLKASDMSALMQEHAVRVARSIADSVPRRNLNGSLLAREFDAAYGPAWHCVVGKSFGSFVTHSPCGFLYFSLEDSLLSVLLFKTEVHVVRKP
ncbi:hypothetical protein SAY87_012149 [Trapa incisa]|uniref:Dynein light chain n=1 Tax=Trapa incisa TaxID=236973 RepID=A0AAN7JJA6_9MYRT|nr:hypothetical protein SAY87_012149 [Trapa incisa]